MKEKVVESATENVATEEKVNYIVEWKCEWDHPIDNCGPNDHISKLQAASSETTWFGLGCSADTIDESQVFNFNHQLR